MAQCPNTVFTVIVTYNGANTIENTLKACRQAAGEYGPVEIIDNASRDRTRQAVADLSWPGMRLTMLAHNIGVAAAYNLALAHAMQCGARWLFILDQDTRCHPDCLKILLDAANRLDRLTQSVGALCPTVVNQRFPDMCHYPYCWQDDQFQPIVPASKSADLIAIDSTVTSGTFYRVDALKRVGGFCEKYFIDFVDHECHLRLRHAGFRMFWVLPARIFHHLGQRQVMTSSGLWIEHAPYRYYYMMRNMLEGLYRLGGMRALVKFGVAVLRHGGRILLYGQAPIITLGYILKGLLHAVLGRFGALDTF